MVKNKNYFYLSEGMENCRMSGKKSGQSGNFEVDDKWQPCQSHLNLVCEESKLHIEEHM